MEARHTDFHWTPKNKFFALNEFIFLHFTPFNLITLRTFTYYNRPAVTTS